MPFQLLGRVLQQSSQPHLDKLRHDVMRDLLWLFLAGDSIRLFLFPPVMPVPSRAALVIGAKILLFNLPGFVLLGQNRLKAASRLLTYSSILFAAAYLQAAGGIHSSGLVFVISLLVVLPMVLRPNEAVWLVLAGTALVFSIAALQLAGHLPEPRIRETELIRVFNLTFAIANTAIPCLRGMRGFIAAADDACAASADLAGKSIRLSDSYEELKAEHMRFETLAEASPVGILHRSAAGEFRYHNSQILRMWTCSSEDFCETTFLERIVPEDREEVGSR